MMSGECMRPYKFRLPRASTAWIMVDSRTWLQDVFTYNVGPMLPYLQRRMSDTVTECVYQVIWPSRVDPAPLLCPSCVCLHPFSGSLVTSSPLVGGSLVADPVVLAPEQDWTGTEEAAALLVGSFLECAAKFELAQLEGVGTCRDLRELRGFAPLPAEELLDIIVGDLKRHHLRFYVSTCASCVIEPPSGIQSSIRFVFSFDSSTFLIEVCRITHCSQAEAARQLHAMFVDRRFREPTEMAKPFTEVLRGTRTF